MAKRKRPPPEPDTGRCQICDSQEWTVELMRDLFASKRPVPPRIRLCQDCFEKSESLSHAFLNEDGTWKK